MDEVKVFAAKAPLRVVRYEEDERVLARGGERGGIDELVLSSGAVAALDGEGEGEGEGGAPNEASFCSAIASAGASGSGTGLRAAGNGIGPQGDDLLESLVQELHTQLPSVAKTGNLDAEALRVSYDHLGPWFGLR